jgi:hypothetical protein
MRCGTIRVMEIIHKPHKTPGNEQMPFADISRCMTTENRILNQHCGHKAKTNDFDRDTHVIHPHSMAMVQGLYTCFRNIFVINHYMFAIDDVIFNSGR